MRNSFVGELGYELHIESDHCVPAYKQLTDIGRKYGLKDAGFRAYSSLNCEAGSIQFNRTQHTDKHLFFLKKNQIRFASRMNVLNLILKAILYFLCACFRTSYVGLRSAM